MIKWLFAVLFLSISFQVYAQQRVNRPPQVAPTFESFESSLSDISDQDSLLSEYYKFVLQSFRSNPNVVPRVAEMVLELDALSEIKRQAFYNLMLSKYWERPRADSAAYYAEKSLVLFKEISEIQQILSLKISLGNLYVRTNDYLKAEEQFLDAVEIVEEREVEGFNKDFLVERLANLYVRVGATEIAISQYEQLLDSETTIRGRCETFLRISNAYRINGELDKAKEVLIECDASEDLEVSRLVSIKKTIGTIEKEQGNYTNAIVKLKEAVALQNTLPRKDFTSYLFLAQAYIENKDFQEAKTLLPELESFNINRQQLPARVEFYKLRAEIEFAEQNYLNALIEIEKALDNANKMQPTLLQIDVLVLKGRILEKLDRYKEAYSISSQVVDRKEIVEQRAKEMEDAITRVRFQIRAKNDQIATVQSQLGTVRVKNAIMILILIILSLYVIYRYRIHFLLKEERTRNKIARDLHDDLSATLSSISFFSEAAKREYSEQKSSVKFLDRIDESAIEAKEKINDIIWAIEPENDDWTSFLAKCKRYAAEMFESKEIDYKIDVDTKLELKTDIKVRNDLWLIFKEMITNIVRHSEATKAEISIEKHEKGLVLIVKDNGKGFDKDLNKNGNGLSNIEHRAKNLQATLDMTSDKKGTIWRLSIIQ
jgi:signal transduction histidine kinase